MSLFFICVILLMDYVHTANILGFFMAPSYSHQIVYQPIWKELSLRGHKVAVVTPNPLNDSTLTNLTEINVQHAYRFVSHTEVEDAFGKELNMFASLEALFALLSSVVEDELKNLEVQALISNSSSRFDLILIECLHPLLYGLAGRFNAPLIGLASYTVMKQDYDNVGNPTNPAMYTDTLLPFHDKKLCMWQKITNLFFDLWSKYYHEYIFMPQMDKLARKYFRNDIPYLGYLQKNQQLLFLNTNPHIQYSRPNVPVVLEMSQMHIKPVKPLPKKLRTFLDEATNGVIYFSLGTNLRKANLPDKLFNVIIETLSTLPYKVIWKWKAKELPRNFENILVEEWFPQQDVLAHSNVRVFMTQGGAQSLEESISREVPLVAMPFLFDQSLNAQRIVDLEIGLKLDPLTVTSEELRRCIIEVAENNKYKKRVKQAHRYLSDRPMTGLQKVVWWSEYVLKHKGTPHLRSPSADIPLVEFLLADIVAVATLTFILISYLLSKVISIICKFCKTKFYVSC